MTASRPRKTRPGKAARHQLPPPVAPRRMPTANHLFSFIEGNMLEEGDVEDFLCQGGNLHQRNSKGETLAHVAVRAHDIDVLKVLLAAGARARVVDHERLTPLHWAVKLNDIRLIEPLLSAGARVDAQNDEGITPLMRLCADERWHSPSTATQSRLTGSLQLLLRYPFNPGVADAQGWTALHHAAARGNLVPARLLLEAGVTPGLWDLASRQASELLALHHPGMVEEWQAMEERQRLSVLPAAAPVHPAPRL